MNDQPLRTTGHGSSPSHSSSPNHKSSSKGLKNAAGLLYGALLQSPIKEFVIWNVFVTKMSHIDSNKYLQPSKKKGTYRTLTAYILAPHNLEFKQRKRGRERGKIINPRKHSEGQKQEKLFGDWRQQRSQLDAANRFIALFQLFLKDRLQGRVRQGVANSCCTL
jgi:hypothetical protein